MRRNPAPAQDHIYSKCPPINSAVRQLALKTGGFHSHMSEYGVLAERNIERVSFGDYDFNTWYGNGAYFSPGSSDLGVDCSISGRRKSAPVRAPQFWLDCLYVCDFCFKYSTDRALMAQHRAICPLNKAYPPLGTLVYADSKSRRVIKRIRGFRHELFCQNLALFGKLFLDDKSVYYNVDAFDFYVVYAPEPSHDAGERARLKPMGFFSKEVNAWDEDNNLACICVFPPFQRLRLGSLLVEFLYALARVTPGQARLGPEFPLSPFGQATYLRFWAKRLAFVIWNDSLRDLADKTGFRKDDCLLALEYMGVLFEAEEVILERRALRSWCDANNVDPTVLATSLDPAGILF